MMASSNSGMSIYTSICFPSAKMIATGADYGK